MPGEGLVGQIYLEQKSFYLKEAPEDYLKITSGLGDAKPAYILVVPLKFNDEVLGILELASFRKFEPYQMEFVEELGKNLAATLSKAKISAYTRALLEEAQHQAEELRAQEEEMRQNMEELQATQEKLEQEQLVQEKLRMALQEEKNLFDTFLQTTTDHIYFKDQASKFIRLSHSMAKLFNVQSVQELMGKSDADFFAAEHSHKAYEDEQQIIRTGQPILNMEEKEVWDDGTVSWVHTSKLPLVTHTGEIVGTFGVSRNITQRKLAEQSLAKEKEFLDALLRYTPQLIYFKDVQGHYTRASQAFAEFVGLRNAQDLLGKTDEDVFASEFARKNREKECEVMHTGLPIQGQRLSDKILNGKVSEVIAYKFPLANGNGKTAGVFGIFEVPHVSLEKAV
ncbi:MAG: PAS domain-containing protein [Bacteroidia bacterium]|nr:PAS domain-containing protein [Bacteroidia bacterium]